MKRPLGNILIPYGTPYHVTDLFLQLVKITFADTPEDYEFHYDEHNFEKTRIAVDTTFNKESEIYGKRPTVVVSRGGQGTRPFIVGDLGAAHLPSHTRAGSGLVNSAINASIVSRSKDEAEILGQHVFGMCMLSRTHLPNILGVHMVDSISLGDVARMEDDDAMYVAQLSVQYSTQYRWTQSEAKPILDKMLGQVIARRSINHKLPVVKMERPEWDGPPMGTPDKATGKYPTLVQATAANMKTPQMPPAVTPTAKPQLTFEQVNGITAQAGSFGTIF